MNTGHFTSAAFWEEPECFVASEITGGIPDLGESQSSVIFRTSGSTGPAKWIVLEKRAMLVSAKAVNLWLRVGRESKWGLALPTDHVGGFAIFARAFEAGCPVTRLEGKWDARRFVSWVAENGVTHASLVPTQLHDLVESEMKGPECLQALVIGGGRLSDQLGQAARGLGWPVLASYGMTEAGSQIATQSIASLDFPFSESPLEVLPIWQVETDGNRLLSIAGEALFSGTIREEGGRFRFVPRSSGPFATNDRVMLAGNILKPLGRADSLVKVMGVLVDIESVENSFLKIVGGAIQESRFAVIPLRDARREHLLAAVFEGEEPPGCVRSYNSSAPGIERIARSFVIDSFPRTGLGKLRRNLLAEICEEKR